PADPGYQWFVPLLEEHSQPFLEARAGIRDAIEVRPQTIGEPLRFRLAPDQTAKHRDHLQDFGHAALVEDDDVHAPPRQLRAEVGLKIGKRENEVRFQRLDFVELRVDERGYFRLEPGFRWANGIAGNADDPIALAEQVERLCRLFGQADDARRI